MVEWNNGNGKSKIGLWISERINEVYGKSGLVYGKVDESNEAHVKCNLVMEK